MDWAGFRAINGLAGRWSVLDEAFRFFANDYMVPTAVVALLVVGWFGAETRWRRVVVHALLALLLANLVVKLFNLAWFRPRPFTFNDVTLLFYYPSDSSFPSNSAAAMWSLAWATWLRDRRSRIGQGAVVLAALMGFSRVWIGVHYPLDIIGGAVVGVLSAGLVERNGERLRPLTDGLVRLAGRLGLA